MNEVAKQELFIGRFLKRRDLKKKEEEKKREEKKRNEGSTWLFSFASFFLLLARPKLF